MEAGSDHEQSIFMVHSLQPCSQLLQQCVVSATDKRTSFHHKGCGLYYKNILTIVSDNRK